MSIFDINKVKSSGAARHLLNACTLAKTETVTHIHLIVDPQYRALATTALMHRLSRDFSETLHHRAIVHVLVGGEISSQLPSKQDKQKSNTVNSIIIRRPQVQARTGLSRSTIYELVSAGRFPAPIRLSDRRVGWLESDVADWIASRVAQSRRDLPTVEMAGSQHDRAAAGIVIQWAKPKELT